MAIRPDTDPKSAASRSRAPKGELEQYGVWVKAEPQDVIEEGAGTGSGDLDFDLPGDSSSLPEESFLSEDEEKLLGSFDAEFEPSSGSAVSSGDASGPLPDIEDMPPLEESLLDVDFSPSPERSGSAQTLDISLDDIESARAPSPIHPGVEIDMGTVEGLDAPSEAAASSAGPIEDVSSEFLDVVEETESASTTQGESEPDFGPDFGTGLDDVTSEFLDIEGTTSAPKAIESSTDFEPLDIDLQFDDTASQSSGTDAAPIEAGFEQVTEFDDFLTAEDSTSSEGAKAVFDDVSAVERDLASPVPSVPAGPARGDLSTDILLKIADELSSIRGELVSLKSQITDVMRSAEPAAKKPEETPAGVGEESGITGGFFDEEEDETIALTGDELDNILNTADFTEETVEGEQPLDTDSLSLESSMQDTNLLSETLLPETGDYSSTASEPAIEEVRLGQDDSVDEIELDSLEPETDDLSLVAEEGVTPMTPAPEDSSYLEAAELDTGLLPGESGTLDIGTASFTDETLVEPDLSDFDLETDETEPRLEIDEELPLATFEADSSPEDITLGMEAGPGYSVEESAADAEFLEPVPEIEESNFSEINLHEEGFSSEPSDLEEIDALSDSGLSGSLSPEAPAARPIEPFSEAEEDLILEAEGEPLAQTRAPAAPAPTRALPPKAKVPPASAESPASGDGDRLKAEIKSVLSYLDKLLDSLPEEKIEEFANSEYFDTYKKLFEELGLV